MKQSFITSGPGSGSNENCRLEENAVESANVIRIQYQKATPTRILESIEDAMPTRYFPTINMVSTSNMNQNIVYGGYGTVCSKTSSSRDSSRRKHFSNETVHPGTVSAICKSEAKSFFMK